MKVVFYFTLLVVFCYSLATVNIAQNCVQNNCPTICPISDQECSQSLKLLLQCQKQKPICKQPLQDLASLKGNDTIPSNFLSCFDECNNKITSNSYYYNFFIKECQINCFQLGRPQQSPSQLMSIQDYEQASGTCNQCTGFVCKKSLDQFNLCKQTLPQCIESTQILNELNPSNSYPFSVLACNQTCIPGNTIGEVYLQQIVNCWQKSLLQNQLSQINDNLQCQSTQQCLNQCLTLMNHTTMGASVELYYFNNCQSNNQGCTATQQFVQNCTNNQTFPQQRIQCYTYCFSFQNYSTPQFLAFRKCSLNCFNPNINIK